jgi:fused signal recognition particle receptor
MEASIFIVVAILVIGFIVYLSRRSQVDKPAEPSQVPASTPQATTPATKATTQEPTPASATKPQVPTESAQASASPEAPVSTQQVPQAQSPERQAPSPQAPAPVAEPEEELVSLKTALASTEKSFFGRIKALFANEDGKKNLEDIEEILYTSDLGPQTVQKMMAHLEDALSRSEKSNIGLVKEALREEMLSIFNNNLRQFDLKNTDPISRLNFAPQGPSVWIVVGVNGAGKTTSIGKIAHLLSSQGKKVLIAAGDTFRAAAGGQLKVWADRAQVELYSPENVTDPSAVAFDAVGKAIANNFDVVIVDTAGRLHTQANLMEEIKKVKRVIRKQNPQAPHEVLIVLDANQGQNALQQAKEFHQALGLTGVVMTKLDGTSKGGVAVGVANELDIPIKLIGVGEKIKDLRVFTPNEFLDAIL